MKVNSSKLQTILGLILILIILSLIAWIIISLLNWFKKLESDVSIAIVVAAASIIASTGAVILGRYLENKKDREIAHRDKKVDFYNDLTAKLFSSFHANQNSEEENEIITPEFFREIHRKLILWSSPKVIIKYAEWHQVLTDIDSRKQGKVLIAMVDFYLSIREDLGLTNKGIEHDHIVRFLLQEPELFMQMYKANPNVTFAEITKFEKLNKLK